MVRFTHRMLLFYSLKLYSEIGFIELACGHCLQLSHCLHSRLLWLIGRCCSGCLEGGLTSLQSVRDYMPIGTY